MAAIVGWPLSIGYSAEIERVEPPNWWVGFQHPVLQLQVYGEDVGTLSPSIDWPGVSIDEVIATGNPNYLFLRLSIGPDTEAGEFDIVFTGADGSIAHAKTLSVDPYGAEADRREFFDGWFVPSMPDLNQDNPLMSVYLIQNAIRWIEYLGLAGVRMDTYPYSGGEFMAEWTRRVMEEFPDFNVVGEEWTENPVIAAYWQGGAVKHDGYRSWLRSVMDFPLNSVLASSLVAEERFSNGFRSLYSMLANDVLYPDPNELVIFGDNHDMRRIYGQLGEDYPLFELAMVYLATMRGAPQIYYGTELPISSGGDHGIIRSDFPGGWDGDAVDAVSGMGLTEDQRRAQDLVSTLFNWRKDSPAVHRGGLTHFLPKDAVYVYFRYLDDEKVMVVLNKNTDPYTPELQRFGEVLGDSVSGVDVIRGGEYDLSSAIELAPRTALVLQVD